MYVCQMARVDCISCTNALFSGVELHGSDEATLNFFPRDEDAMLLILQVP